MVLSCLLGSPPGAFTLPCPPCIHGQEELSAEETLPPGALCMVTPTLHGLRTCAPPLPCLPHAGTTNVTGFLLPQGSCLVFLKKEQSCIYFFLVSHLTPCFSSTSSQFQQDAGKGAGQDTRWPVLALRALTRRDSYINRGNPWYRVGC